MKTSILKSGFYSVETHNPEYILINWVAAVNSFYNCYQQVVTCVGQVIIEPDQVEENRKKAYIGQCPVNLLVELINAMQEELKKLSQDMDQTAKLRPLSVSNNYKKLTAHTRVLNQLNQQAQRGLHLTSLSNS